MTNPAAYTPRQRIAALAIAGLVPLVAAVAGALLILSWAPELPDRVAVHWGWTGAPDGYGSLLGLVLPVLVIVPLIAIPSAVALIRLPAGQGSRAARRGIAGINVGLAVFLTTTVVGGVFVQRRVADAADAGSIVPWLLGGLLAGIVLGAIAGLLAPRPAEPAASHEAAPPVLALAESERVVWQRRTGPTARLLVLLLTLVVVAYGSVIVTLVVSGEDAWPIALVLAVVLTAVLASLFWRVRVTEAGLSARSVLGFPRFRVPLAEITEARAVAVSAFAEFGGWGIRWGFGGRFGIVVRAGEALEVHRGNDRTFVVTVADAQTAAAVLNGLVARAQR